MQNLTILELEFPGSEGTYLMQPCSSLLGRKCPPFSPCSVLIHLLTPVPILSFTFLYTVCPCLSDSGCYICSENAWMDQNPLELLQIIQVSGERIPTLSSPTLIKVSGLTLGFQDSSAKVSSFLLHLSLPTPVPSMNI